MKSCMKNSSNSTKNFNKEKSQLENASKSDKGKSQPANATKPEVKVSDPNIPDRSYGDYYCRLCDSHMNSDAMWTAHITGKRHQKSIMKGDTDSKYEPLDVESDIKYELRNVKDPIVGLSYIHEIRRKDSNIPPFYSCFLCHATLATIPLVIEHVICLKHRLNYIKENDPPEYELLQATNLKKDHLEPLVQEAAMKLEQKDGRGEVLVKQEKVKQETWTDKKTFSMKRSYNHDKEEGNVKDGYQQKPAKNKNNDVIEPPIWKSVSSGKVYEKEKTKYKVTEYFDDDHHSKYSKRSFSRDIRDNSPGPSRSYKRSEFDDYPRKDDDYSRRLERDVYPKQSEFDDYPRKDDVYSRRLERDVYPKQSDYDDDYFRKRDHRRSSRSPIYDTRSSRERISNASLEPIKRSYSPDEYYPQSSSHRLGSNLLPHEMVKSDESKGFSDIVIFKEFLEKVLELPTEVLLKIFLVKMENMEIRETEELSLLSKIIVKGQSLLIKNLPPELQELFKQKFSSSTACSNSPNPPVIEKKPSRPKSDKSFLEDLLNSVNSAGTNPVASSSTSSGPPSSSASQYPMPNQNTSFSAVQTQPLQYINPPVNQNVPPQQYYQSSQPSNPYTAPPPYNYSTNSFGNQASSSIPGLSLSSSEKPGQPSYNSYQAIPPPTQPYAPNNFPY